MHCSKIINRAETNCTTIGEQRMKKKIFVLTGILTFFVASAQADTATEQEIKKLIVDNNAYTKVQLKGAEDTVSSEGSLEFWSSGGLLHKVDADLAPDEFESFAIDVKHIHVITLVPGKAAVAQYYSEGSMDRKNGAAVNNYRTRATQVFVKEGGKWKVRAAHWSPIAGGSGTSVTSLED
jgi:hypothetical protein